MNAYCGFRFRNKIKIRRQCAVMYRVLLIAPPVLAFTVSNVHKIPSRFIQLGWASKQGFQNLMVRIQRSSYKWKQSSQKGFALVRQKEGLLSSVCNFYPLERNRIYAHIWRNFARTTRREREEGRRKFRLILKFS